MLVMVIHPYLITLCTVAVSQRHLSKTPSFILRKQLVHMSPFFRLFIFQENGQNFQRRVQIELVGPAPSLKSSNTDAGLDMLAHS